MSHGEVSPARVRAALRPRWAARFVVAAAVAATVYAVTTPSAVADLASALVMLGTIAAGRLGIRRNQPIRRLPWNLYSVAAVLWSVANVLRAASGKNDGEVWQADVVSLAAYVFGIAFLGLLIRSARGRRDGAALDSALVALAATLIGWIILGAPSLALSIERTNFQRVVDLAFPALDAVLVSLALRLLLGHRRGVPAAAFISASVGFTLIADLMWALSASKVLVLPVFPQILGYMLGFGCFGACALHPSMRELGQPADVEVRPLGGGRVGAMALALVLPTAAALLRPPHRQVEWIVIGVSSTMLVGLIFWRFVRAVGEATRFEERLRYQATHDLLTGLPNRWWITHQLDTIVLDAWARRHVVGVLHVDLDDLKRVNDTWGHAAGDEMMVSVASRFRRLLGADDAVAHLGGGGFAVVTAVEHRDELGRIAERLLETLEQPLQLDVGEVFTSACVGITATNPGGAIQPALDLLREADTALHVAKADIERRVVWFDASMRTRTDRRMELERDLRRAIDRGELRVFYQPIVSLRTGEWVGFEALVRWQHPEVGLVSPGEFIPLAEDTGLIVPIGEFVLREAVRQIAEWRARYGRDWKVSVNLSVRQLRAPDLVPMVAGVVAESRLPIGTVWIELTESMMMLDDAAELLADLRAAGTRLAMDDFGTGYSSLSYLKRYPIDRVKIDRAFVIGLGDDADSLALVTAIVRMASALGLECVAEGVETDEQRRRLTEIGCQQAQGFLFERPVPPADIERHVALAELADGAGSSDDSGSADLGSESQR